MKIMNSCMLAGIALCAAVSSAAAQGPAEFAKGMARLAGTDEGSGIAYALITLDGKVTDPTVVQPASPPRLTAQCTRDAVGKLRFELLADLGGGGPLAFFPPWEPTKDSLYPPAPVSVNVTMEYLGYTKVKPVKRQWAYVKEMPDELRYGTPGFYSTNMEPVTISMQYLRSLPTLRLTVPGRAAVEFETLKWQEKLRAEPLCKASGL